MPKAQSLLSILEAENRTIQKRLTDMEERHTAQLVLIFKGM